MNDQWAEVRNCNWLHEAHFVKSVLESEGIEVQLPDEHTIGLQPGIATALGGVKVFVHQSDLKRANELLESAEIPEEDEPQ